MENITEAIKNKADAAEKPQHQWLTVDGVYIQDINGKLWKAEEWNDSVKANAVAIITPEHNFRIALKNSPITSIQSRDIFRMDITPTSVFDRKAAKADFNGVNNTQEIIKMQALPIYAAGACNEYTFPDGTTKGYLPSLGELNLAYQNKDAVDSALSACGGTALEDGYYWSSTFFGVSGGMNRNCWWGLNWYNGAVSYHLWHYDLYVRAFAPFEF